MLQTLSIRNFVLVEASELDMPSGLTVLTGETGAGKSLLLDALGAVLGDKAQPFWVRPGADKAEVAATFDVSQLPVARQWLIDHDLDSDDECMLRRTIGSDGRSKAFINGTSVTLTQLRQFAELLVEMHSQHEHHALLQPVTQLALLDTWAGLGEQVKALRLRWRHWHELCLKRDQLAREASQQQEKWQLLSFQNEELSALALIEGEAEELAQEQTRLAHAQEIRQSVEQVLSLLNGERQTVISQLHQASRTLEQMASFDASLSPLAGQIQNAMTELEDVANSLLHQRQIDVDHSRLTYLEQRLAEIHRLARKYFVAPETLWQKAQQVADELAQLSQQDAEREGFQAAIEAALTDYQKEADALSERRLQAAPELARQVMEQLAELGMAHSQLSWNLSRSQQPEPNGWDQAEIRFSANPGQALYPMAKVASGGELSRISLAIEVCVASHINLPVLVFDEVDVGVGGGVADSIGQKLASIATSKQVLCITHQAQVAAWGDAHLHIAKHTDGQSTTTHMVRLDEKGRVEELARMLGTRENSEQTLAHARHMLDRASSLKRQQSI